MIRLRIRPRPAREGLGMWLIESKRAPGRIRELWLVEAVTFRSGRRELRRYNKGHEGHRVIARNTPAERDDDQHPYEVLCLCAHGRAAW